MPLKYNMMDLCRSDNLRYVYYGQIWWDNDSDPDNLYDLDDLDDPDDDGYINSSDKEDANKDAEKDNKFY
ncbi:hypothetical protein FHL15_005782 [Xylaria flabelliformis]|uniref:Uncharacterized protein n=1 Tax=Xylaria flabelliformis TaxID=2512241 RepID=A0A553HZ38_9PEZI|nr:hypothetical protein FHL15_005782 [Xylaria flabelliformis]